MPFGGTKFGLIKRIQDFNKNSNTYKGNSGINYSLPDTDYNGGKLSEGQREYFRNSKAVDDEGKLVPVFHTTPHGGFTEFNNRFSDDRRSFFSTDNALMSMSYAKNPKRAFTDKAETLDDLKRLYNVNGNTPARGMIEFSTS